MIRKAVLMAGAVMAILILMYNTWIITDPLNNLLDIIRHPEQHQQDSLANRFDLQAIDPRVKHKPAAVHDFGARAVAVQSARGL